VAVAVVGVEGDVGHDAEIGEFFFERGDGAEEEVVLAEGFAGVFRFAILWDLGEEEDGVDAELQGGFALAEGEVEGEAGAAGDGGDGLMDVLALAEELGEDEAVGGEAGFADEGAEGLGAAEAAGAAGGVVGGGHGIEVDSGKWTLGRRMVGISNLRSEI
jgi:hypothetical protein